MTLRGKINLSLGVALTSLLLVSVAARCCISWLIEDAGRVTHTHAVRTELETVSALVVQAESSVRGYLLTGESRFLNPYYRSVQQLPPRLRDLESLASENPVRKRSMARLAALTGQRLDRLGQTLRLRSEGPLSASDLSRLNAGEDLTSAIRGQITGALSEEDRLLILRSAHHTSTALWTSAVISGGFGVAIVLAIIAGVVIRQDLSTREAAEAALRDSESRLREAQELARLGEWEMELPGGGLRWPEHTCSLLGLRPGEAPTFGTFLNLLHPCDRGELERLVDALNSETAAFSRCCTVISPKGVLREMDVRGRYFAPRGGRPGRLVGTIMDVTEQKQAETALRASEERLKLAIEAGGLGLWEWDLATGEVHCDQQVLDIFGFGDAAVVPETEIWGNAIHPAYRESVAKAAEWHRTGAASRFLAECRTNAPAGEERWISIQGRIVQRDPEAFPICMMGTIQDVSERVHLKEQHVRMQKLLDDSQRLAQIGGWEIDPEDQRITWSPGTYRIFERDPSEGNMTVQELLRRYFGPTERVNCIRAYRRLLQEKGRMQYECCIDLPGGRSKYLCVLGEAVTDAGGEVRKIRGSAQDITGRKIADRRLTASLAEKEMLLKEVHHRVKNNLQIISSLLNLQSATTEDPGILECLMDANHRVQSMALIHEQLYQSEDVAGIDFSGYIHELATQLYGSYCVSPDAIGLDLQVDRIYLGIDQAIPCSLILNELVTNSLKHAFPGGRRGTISIGMHEVVPGLLRLSVGDDGIGLPAELDLESEATLGLRIIQILTRQLAGTLQVERCRGARFAVIFCSSSSKQ